MHPFHRLLLFVPLVVAVLLVGCAGPRTVVQQEVEVEGRVSVRGNEPFTAVLLETEEGNWYVLELTPEQRSALVNPTVQRARGTVHRGEWNGKAWAVLRVSEIQRINR